MPALTRETNDGRADARIGIRAGDTMARNTMVRKRLWNSRRRAALWRRCASDCATRALRDSNARANARRPVPVRRDADNSRAPIVALMHKKGWPLMSKILLHACCGPCSLEPVRLLQEEGHEPAIYFYNPNIHPAEEYQHRLQTLHQWADPAGVQVIEGPYDPRAWEQSVGTLHREGCPMQERCRACYRMRLQKTAEAATELGF